MNNSETTRPARARTSREPDVIVFGQIARDLVLVVDEAPGPGQSAGVRERQEMLGGKGDIPAGMLLTEDDAEACQPLFRPGRWVSVQLQQPPAAALAAAAGAHQAGCRVVLDGAPADDQRAALLAAADVLRADARETGLLAGSPVRTAAAAERVAADLLRQGPSVVALAVGDAGNLIAWPEDRVFLPLTDTPVADTTGAGDAFTAALIMTLAQDADPRRAARLAVAAAGATVGHPGGRPALSPKALQDQLTSLA